jgi:hypothetical protein
MIAIFIETDAGERTIAARLVMYVQHEFPEYHVDVDFNRAGQTPKRLNLPRECAGYRNENDQSLAVPDVIVHRRGAACPTFSWSNLRRRPTPIRTIAIKSGFKPFETRSVIATGQWSCARCENRVNPEVEISDWFDA